jgi:hypothetical protein
VLAFLLDQPAGMLCVYKNGRLQGVCRSLPHDTPLLPFAALDLANDSLLLRRYVSTWISLSLRAFGILIEADPSTTSHTSGPFVYRTAFPRAPSPPSSGRSCTSTTASTWSP